MTTTVMPTNYKMSCGECTGLRLLKKEFQLKNFWSNLGESGHGRINWIQGFGSSRFSFVPGWLLVVWRTVIMLFSIGVIFAGIGLEETDGDQFSFPYWLWFLTHWIMIINTLYSVLLLVATIKTQYVWGENSQIYKERVMPRFIQAAWILLSMAMTGGLFVMLLNWVLLRPTNPRPTNILQHGVVWGFVVVDYICGKQPFLLFHGIWVSVLGVLYGTWTLIHSTLDIQDKNGCFCIYTPIQWKTAPGMAAFWAYGSPFIVILPMQLLFWAFNFFRVQAIDTTSTLDLASKGGKVTQVTIQDNA